MAQKKSNSGRGRSGSRNATAARKAGRQAARAMRRSPVIAVVCVVLFAVAFAVWYFGGCMPGSTTTTTAPKVVDGTVEVHMIDVGQADAILVRTGGGDMLIDTGDRTNDSKTALVNYLSACQVTELEWLVLTHPDADHIGGAVKVFETCTVKRVLLSDYINTSQTYINTIEAILESNAEVFLVETDDNRATDGDVTATIWRAGQVFSLGDADFKVLGPIKTPTINNNASVVMRMTYGASSVLFTGDMEDEGNNEIGDVLAAYGSELRSDILKVGHHGSVNANSAALIDAVSPTIALISCGEGNSYGHPHSQVLTLLEAAGAEIHRTDLEGSIVYRSNGTAWTRVGSDALSLWGVGQHTLLYAWVPFRMRVY